MLSSLIVSLVIIAFAIVVRLSLKNFNQIPKGFQNFIELIVETISKLTSDNMGVKNIHFSSWFLTVFMFILLSNLSGLLALRSPTSDLSVTISYALTTFILIHFIAITRSGKAYFRSYFEPNFIFFPLNILGELALPISLSFRLFGNILGGVIVTGMLYNMLPFFLKIGIPVIFHVYFDVFSGVLQAYIFCILSMTFIKNKLPD